VKTAAFFDLDRTLITANSATLWMKRERRMGRISRKQVAWAAFQILTYKMGFVDMESVTVKALQTVKGLEEETLRRWTHEWYRKEVKPHTAPGALPVLEEHRRRGHKLVLLTSASRYESEAAVVHFNLDAFLCTGYETKNGRLTGDVIRPVCYGEGKVVHAQRYAEANNVDMKESFFYTDSITDLPMLLKVANPRVVNPDTRLTWEARRRGWPVLDWR